MQPQLWDARLFGKTLLSSYEVCSTLSKIEQPQPGAEKDQLLVVARPRNVIISATNHNMMVVSPEISSNKIPCICKTKQRLERFHLVVADELILRDRGRTNRRKYGAVPWTIKFLVT